LKRVHRNTVFQFLARDNICLARYKQSPVRPCHMGGSVKNG